MTATRVVYIGGHVDDPLLFAGDRLYRDLHTEGRTVHVIIPDAAERGAGDEVWQTNEAGLLAAMAASVDPRTLTEKRVTVNGHPITRITATGRYVVWFLRMPDGGLDGNGYPARGYVSLTKLRDGAIDSITTVDGSTTYHGWNDFTATLRAVVQSVTGVTVVNCSDHDRAVNSGDHPDHYATADALDTFAAADGLPRRLWVSYDVANRPANLPAGPGLDAKNYMWRQYGWATVYGGPNEQEWAWWGARSYSRWVPGDLPDALPPWPLPPGHFYGSTTSTDPACHSGRNPADRPVITGLQQWLIAAGWVDGVTDWHDPWADGWFGQATAQAVLNFQRTRYPDTVFWSAVYPGDYEQIQVL